MAALPLLVAVCTAPHAYGQTDERPFVMTWTVNAGGWVKIPVDDENGTYGATGEYTIDWGDGTVETISGTAEHRYSNAGNYAISITGNFTKIYLHGSIPNGSMSIEEWMGSTSTSVWGVGSTPSGLLSIDQWGDVKWTSMAYAFSGARNMVYNATDVPDLSSVTDMSHMFYFAKKFNGDLSAWNVSGVTDMSHMFYQTTAFNGNLSAWNVSGVTDMSHMFYESDTFNQDISAWDVSSVTDTSWMFSRAFNFNQDISSWNVSSVTDMSRMFANSIDFNQDISSWDVSHVTDMHHMFYGSYSFNHDISSWDVSHVTDMSHMFQFAYKFNRNISAWDVSSVTDMNNMFKYAETFNGDISAWNVSGVTDMNRMFQFAYKFNGDISAWDVSGVTDMNRMFQSAYKFNGDISAWDVSGVTDMNNMFNSASAFKQNLGRWYIVPEDMSIVDGDSSLVVTTISAQNAPLGSQNPVYAIGVGHDSSAFEMGHNALKLKATPAQSVKSAYTVSVTATGAFGTNNHRFINITVAEYVPDTTPPYVSMIWRDSPNNAITNGATMQFGIMFSEDVQNVDVTDFVLTGTSNASITHVSGSRDEYGVIVSATTDGTATLALATDNDIKDMEDNGLIDPIPTAGTDHTYTVDTTAPTVTSIERYSPDAGNTDSQALVYKVTFSENVTGVNAGDFALSTDSTGAGSITSLAGSGSQYLVNVSAAQDGTYNLDVAQDSGIADAADNPLSSPTPTGADHTYTVDTTAPTVASIARSDPAAETTSAQTLVFAVTFSESVTGVDQADFVLSSGGTGTGSVTNLAGSGSQYLVSVSATQDGTYNLDLVSSGHGIANAADNPLADPNPTGADHTYAVDTTAPTVTSIVRSDPAEATTSGRTLVFAVTFSEDVTGVDLSDFVLSPGSTGGGSSSGQFTQTSAPAAPITDHNTIQDTITVGPSGTATSVSVAVDITHTYIGDLVVELVAPDGTAQTLHSRTGSSANDIDRTYTPDFDGTGIAGDWTLRIRDHATRDTGTLNSWTLTIDHGGADSPVTGLTGSGGQYLVNVSAAQDGTYNLDLVSSGHGITDTPGNPLNDTSPTGEDQSYTVTILNVIPNSMPSVDAGSDQTVQENSAVTLSGTASDADDDPLTYLWSHDSDLIIALSDAASLSTSFTAPQVDSDTTITFTLAAYDETSNATDTTSITITDSTPPVVADAPRSIGSVTLASTVPGVVEASWDAPAEEPGDYRIAWAKVGEGFRTWTDLTVNAFPTTTSHAITDLEEGAEYKVIVRARYDGGSGDWSGQYTVTVKARVQDTTDPTITLTGANPVSVTTGTAYSDPGATCTDDTDAGPTLATTSSVDTLTAGTYQVTYTCTDSSSNTATATRDVVVADAPDTTDPTITLTGANPYNVTTGTAYSDPGATCTDDTDAGPTLATTSSVDTLTAGTYQVTYTCTDSSSNTATATRDVVVADAPDTTDPTITLTGANPASVTTGTAYSDPGATCTDDTDASPTLATTSSVDTLTAGTYQVTYTCTDSSSNTATATRDVVVADAPRSIGSVTLASTVPGVVEASWDAPAEEPGDYRIAWAKVGEGFRTWTDLTVNAFPTTTSHAITDLEEGAEYKVMVRARYDGGSGDWSGQYTVTVKASVQDTTDPTITLTGANPAGVTTGTAYSDPGATCTDDTDASPTLATTSTVDTLTAGTYQVTYTCTDSSGNTATATRDVVVADAPDTTAPTVSSIERHIPTDQNTGSQTLVYRVTFSENVTGVDVGDFVLSPDSPVAGGASGQFAQTSEPAIPIPDRNTIRDSITVEQSGTATSVSVAVDITHTYIGDLVIDLIAPDGTTRTLHDRTGYETDGIDQTYAPDFGGVGIAGDWTLRIRDGAGGDTGTLNGWTLTINHGSTASPVTEVSGSGDTYQVTVSATRDGTYNLDLVSPGHGIVDAAGNPLADTTPTGTDHTYTVSTAT